MVLTTPSLGAKPSSRFLLASALILFLLLTLSALAQERAGKIVSIKGTAEVVRAGQPMAARIFQEILTGDAIVVGAGSRVALLLVDGSQYKINANSTFEIRSVGPRPGILPVAFPPPATLARITKGEIWLKLRALPPNYQIETPAVTAAIRGTEINLLVKEDGESILSVLEGVIDYRNPLGAVLVVAGEVGMARVGEAPTKTVLLRPTDAVQWSLYYPEIISFRDFPFITGDPVRLRQLLEETRQRLIPRAELGDRLLLAEILHDLGRPRESREEFEKVLALAPGNPRALAGLGWLDLEERALEGALARFRQVRPPSVSSVLGSSIALYRLGRILEAEDVILKALPILPPSAKLLTQLALIHLVQGRVAEAREELDRALALDPAYSLAHGLLSNIHLVRNEKEEALQRARQAVSANPFSPSAYIDLSLALQAFFKLEEAIVETKKALDLDPENVQALLQLSRLYFGTDRVKEAADLAERARGIAPEESLVNTSLGFLRLAQGRTKEAMELFKKATEQDSTQGQPHLGLGLAYFRLRMREQGLEELTEAVLLEPKVSLNVSYLAKGLYDVGRRQEALEALKEARALDYLDPTPHLYQGVMLTDLNRPGEAIEATRRSIELNDFRAVYRSRLLLDRDLAVKGVDLSRSFRNLGLSDWALSWATRSVAQDPANSGARLFLARVLFDTGFGATFGSQSAGSELLKTRLLLPVNQNTFNTFNDYTSLLEVPRLSNRAEATLESFDTRDYFINFTGGTSSLAFIQGFDRSFVQGFRPHNDFDDGYNTFTLLKFALGMRSSLMLSFVNFLANRGDVFQDNDFFTSNDPDSLAKNRFRTFEIGLHSQLGPGTNLLLLGSSRSAKVDIRDSSQSVIPFPGLEFLFPLVAGQLTSFDRAVSRFPSLELQGQLQHTVGDHNLLFGFNYYNGKDLLRTFNITNLEILILGTPSCNIFPGFCLQLFSPVRESRTDTFLKFYLQDVWRFARRWTMTLALNYDYARDGNPFQADTLYSSQLSPHFGLTFEPNPRNVIRLAVTRSFQSPLTDNLAPTEVAGLFLDRFGITSSRIWQYQLQWDREIANRGFMRFTAFRTDRDVPILGERRGFLDANRRGVNGSFSWLLTKMLAVSLDYTHIRREDDINLGATGIRTESPRGDDDMFRIRLGFVHPIGLSARLTQSYIRQELGRARVPGAPGDFWITDLLLSYELKNKIGLITFAVDNLFRTRFKLISDSLPLGQGGTLGNTSTIPRQPARRMAITFRYNF